MRTVAKQAKQRLRDKREHERERRSKCLHQDRQLKDLMVAKAETDQSRAGEMRYLTERDMTPRFPVSPAAAKTAREAVAARVKEASVRGWRRGLICFVCCWRLGGMRLSRDVVRYICTFLRPRWWRETSEGLLNLRSGLVRPMPPPPFQDFKEVCRAYDVAEHELWCWGEKAEEICVYSISEDSWRSVDNPVLREIHANALALAGSVPSSYIADYRLIGNWLFALTRHYDGEGKKLLSCDNKARRFDLAKLPDPYIQNDWDYSAAANAGNCLFLLGIAQDCLTFPSVVPVDAQCWCCFGSNWKRMERASDCCITLQVLFLNDLDYGWTPIQPPPVHYSTAPDFFVSADGTQLVAWGGTKNNTTSDGRGTLKDIQDGWTLDLMHANSKWVKRTASQVVKPDWLEVM